jgi:guanine nucleotide-binding protein G(t) subunit alpha 1/2
LWKDPAIQATFEVRAEFQLNDSAPYYFEKVKELAKEGYIPTEADVLRSRARTTGVIENKFTIEKNKFEMFDVGGQRSERKKWFHCFDKVSAVLYVVAVSAYNQVLFEDGETNRMVEALELFDEICNSRWFSKTALILFLNKRDLFIEKIKKVPITVSPALRAYDGDTTSFEDTSEFIIEVFEDRNKTERDIYAHVTCATDKDNVHKVFDTVKDTVMKKGLEAAGLTGL